MQSSQEQKIDPMKSCQENDIRICTRCGSTNVQINGDTIYCNDCHAILCFEHKS